MVETSCDLPGEYMKEHGIKTIAMPFFLNGREHKGGYWQEITPKEFYDALRSGGVATTSQANPDTFAGIFTEYARNGRSLLVITLSGGLSGSFQNAVTGLREVKENYPDCGVYVINSNSATIGHGLLAMLAVRKRAEGVPADRAAEWLAKKSHSVLSLFTVDDLMYLHRGGRLSKLSAVAGGLLGVKPLLNVAPDGTLKLKEKARGRKASLETLAKQLARGVNPGTKLDTVTIAHGDSEADAAFLAGCVKKLVDVREIVVMMMGPVISSHVGPGVIAVFFEADMTHEEYENKFYGGKW
jgi:DegV family protein with EDD domain